MTTLTPAAYQAWLAREKRMVVTTVDQNNVPNSI